MPADTPGIGAEEDLNGSIAMIALLSGIVFLLAVFSGMFGIGVAFAAIPVLSLFLPDLVNQVQPLGLFLNGVTAACSLIGFAISGPVDWRKACEPKLG